MSNSLFRKASLDILPPERAQALEQFAVKAMTAVGMSAGASLSDMEIEDFDQLSEVKGLLDPIFKTRGSLDYVALAVEEGIDIEQHWEMLHSGYFSSLVDELYHYGLHGLHFRMGIVDPQVRRDLTLKLADAIVLAAPQEGYLATSIDHQPHFPISALSCTSSAMALRIEREYVCWHQGIAAQIEKHPYRPEQTAALRHIGGPATAADQVVQEGAIDHLLSEKGSMPFYALGDSQRAIQIEKAFHTLVYNRGYCMRAEGASCESIADTVKPVIQHLLSKIDLSEQLCKAVERQVLVNLFSAFPEGLAMLQAQPEELQGVPLNPMVLTDPKVDCFKHTFSGPLELFRAASTTPYRHRGTQVIEFLSAAGYPIHPDLAFGGFLSATKLHDDLILNCHGHSKIIEEVLLPEHIRQLQDMGCRMEDNQFTPVLIRHLASPDILRQYSDAATLMIIRLALPMAGERDLPSIHQVFRDRPGLVEPMLNIMVETFYLCQQSFDYCGFGGKELKLLGSRAPESMLSDYLERDLGL